MSINDTIPRGVRFAKLPVDAILDRRLGDKDLRVLAYLLSRTSGWVVYTSQVAKALNVSDRTVRRSIARLQEAGYALRQVERVAGLARYPDVSISAIPRESHASGPSQTGDVKSCAEEMRTDDDGQICPVNRTQVSTSSAKFVQKTADINDRHTQNDLLTQRRTIQREDTQRASGMASRADARGIVRSGSSSTPRLGIIDLTTLMQDIQSDGQRSEQDRTVEEALKQLGSPFQRDESRGGIRDPITGEYLPF